MENEQEFAQLLRTMTDDQFWIFLQALVEYELKARAANNV
jgi:hypothetical protein